MIKRLLIFFIINFGALAISGLFTPSGINSEWYTQLQKAPWTPPGWMFGAAWSTIMVCLSFYMSYGLRHPNKKLMTLYITQLTLNVSWTPLFFYLQLPIIGLICILLLTTTVTYIFFSLRTKRILLLPYVIWLLIASSLNLYIVLYN